MGLALERLSARVGPAASLAAGLCVSSVLLMSLVTQVNYVPNDLEHTDAQGVFHISTSLFGLAVPLVQEGVWPVSWLNALVPNPAPGVVIILMVLAATAWVFSRFRALNAVPALVLVGMIAHLGLLALVTDHHSASVSAKNFLKQSWAAPSGQKYQWW